MSIGGNPIWEIGFQITKAMVTLHMALEQSGSRYSVNIEGNPNWEIGFQITRDCWWHHIFIAISCLSLWCNAVACVNVNSILVVIVSAVHAKSFMPSNYGYTSSSTRMMNWLHLVDLGFSANVHVCKHNLLFTTIFLILMFKNVRMFNFHGLPYP